MYIQYIVFSFILLALKSTSDTSMKVKQCYHKLDPAKSIDYPGILHGCCYKDYSIYVWYGVSSIKCNFKENTVCKAGGEHLVTSWQPYWGVACVHLCLFESV